MYPLYIYIYVYWYAQQTGLRTTDKYLQMVYRIHNMAIKKKKITFVSNNNSNMQVCVGTRTEYFGKFFIIYCDFNGFPKEIKTASRVHVVIQAQHASYVQKTTRSFQFCGLGESVSSVCLCIHTNINGVYQAWKIQYLNRVISSSVFLLPIKFRWLQTF